MSYGKQLKKLRKLYHCTTFLSHLFFPPQSVAKFKGEHFPRGSLGIMFISYFCSLQSLIPSCLLEGGNKEFFFFFVKGKEGERENKTWIKSEREARY